MATFRIYQDQENLGALISKLKDVNKVAPQKRAVLGVINANAENTKLELQKALPKKEELEVRDDNAKEVKAKCAEEIIQNMVESRRAPLKDIEVEEPHPTESPMSVEKTPLVMTPELPTAIKTEIDELYDCLVYKDDIYRYLRKIETQHRAKAYYMRRQPDVTYSMRSILVDWLVEVGEEYKLHTQTLFMAVSYIDRFLSCMAVVRAKLQLLGTSALFIASKFEEIYPPDVTEFTYITDDTYTKKQVLRMEHLILKVLSFDLSAPTAYSFVMHVCVSAAAPTKVLFLSLYLCELTLLEADPYLEFNPSLVASGAVAVARHCLGYCDVWPEAPANVSGYCLSHLAPVIAHLNNTHAKSFANPQGAIREKYKSAKYLHVSQVPSKTLVMRDSSLPPV